MKDFREELRVFHDSTKCNLLTLGVYLGQSHPYDMKLEVINGAVEAKMLTADEAFMTIATFMDEINEG